MTANLLEEVLPLKSCITSIQNNTFKVARRIESELKEEKHIYIKGCPNEWGKLPDDKLSKTAGEFGSYISSNRNFIPNYQDRHYYGESISTAFVESTVNEVISRRE
jgi:hypothetical protein